MYLRGSDIHFPEKGILMKIKQNKSVILSFEIRNKHRNWVSLL
jgi:hypothetical protein